MGCGLSGSEGGVAQKCEERLSGGEGTKGGQEKETERR